MTSYGRDQNITKLLDTYNIYIIPMLNPDGYEFSMAEDRLWRKTRTKIDGSSCFGIDPNRNFDVQWGGKKEFVVVTDLGNSKQAVSLKSKSH